MEIVKLGDVVQFDLIYRTGQREHFTLTIVDDSYSDLQAGLLSCSSQIGRIILGEKTGSIIPYFTDEFEAIQIISSTQPSEPSSKSPNKRRKENMEEILSQIEFRDALLFASSSDTKWGSYDADGMSYQSWTDKDSDSTDDEQA